MNEKNYILNRVFNPNNFTLGAIDILSRKEKEKIAKNTQYLRNIAAQCSIKDEEVPNKNISNQVFKTFVANFHSKNVVDLFSSRELRYLIYAMYQIKEVGMMQSLLRILNTNWKDRFFNGLLYYILAYFESAREEVMKEVLTFMHQKLKTYKGKRDKYLLLKHNCQYFQPNGPELLGLTLLKEDSTHPRYCSLKNASQTIFGMKAARLDFEFFSRAIVAYFEKVTKIDTELIKSIIKLHNYDATVKRLIPALIINEKRKFSEIDRDNIRTLAIHLIGDPAIQSKWTFAKGTRDEKHNLEVARDMMSKWITRKIITIFFEKCVEDPERKYFWIQHADLVRDFKLYCTQKTYVSLKQDNRIADVVDSKSCVVMETSSPYDPALGMLIDDYKIIEFTTNRALQIYKTNEMKDINYLSEFNINTLATIQSFNMNHEEGKLSHNSGWEKTLIKWFENHGIL